MFTCFFTYSWEKDKKKAELLDHLLTYIKQQIETLSDGNISVIYDKKSFNVGENFRKREEDLQHSDSVILFFSPEYKAKVCSGNDNGVYREYQLLKEKRSHEYSGIVPILLDGTLETSVTDEFKDIICWDISEKKHLITKNQGKIVLHDALETIVSKIIRMVIKETYAVSYCKHHHFSNLEEVYRALFLESDRQSLPSSCIIKTSAYTKVMSEQTAVVIGRKGSGKSTLLDSIQHYEPERFIKRHKKLLPLNIDDINLDFVYQSLIKDTRKEQTYIKDTTILVTFWEIVIVLQGMLTIAHEMSQYQIDADDDRYEVFLTVSSKIKSLLGYPHDCTYRDFSCKAICHCAAELLSNHIKGNRILANASPEAPLTAAYGSIQASNILSEVFTAEIFQSYCKALRKCNRRIFFSMDGFDTHTNDFRAITNRLIETNPDEYRSRKDFETHLFRELVMLVSDERYRNNNTYMRQLYEAVHFCIILPQDRYDEISKDDYDISKRNCCSLNWDAYDLLEMLIKRLETYYKLSPLADDSLEKRFYDILRQKMPNIPHTLSIIVDNREHDFPLFNYLLRLSFWRPRDIIKNFAIIIQVNQDINTINDFVEDVIKKRLVLESRRIIEDEFLREYQSFYLNLNSILFQFKNFELIQEYDTFYDYLSKVKFCTAQLDDLENTDKKLEVLYRLGVVGLYFKANESNQYGYHICFSFNEGMDPIEDFIASDRRNTRTKIIFNPIFSKRLSLIYNTKDLICNYSWQYIATNHSMKDSIRRL